MKTPVTAFGRQNSGSFHTTADVGDDASRDIAVCTFGSPCGIYTPAPAPPPPPSPPMEVVRPRNLYMKRLYRMTASGWFLPKMSVRFGCTASKHSVSASPSTTPGLVAR